MSSSQSVAASSFTDDAADVTSDRLAKQLGLDGKDGTNAWRVILNSPVESARSRKLVELVIQAEPIVHCRKPTAVELEETPSDWFITVGPLQATLARGPPHSAIQPLFNTHGPVLVAACIAQFNGTLTYVTWGAPSQPIYRVLREASFLPEFVGWVHRDPTQSRNLYRSLWRSLVRVIGQGATPDLELHVPDEITFEPNTPKACRVLANIGLLALPILLNTAEALRTAPGGLPPLHLKAIQANRELVQKLIDKRVKPWLEEGHSSTIWLPNGEATILGDLLAYVHAGLVQMRDNGL